MNSHYGERLALLQRLADRLETAGVPCLLKHHVPSSAPSSQEETTVPALLLGAELGCVRVLYWRRLGGQGSRPFFVWRDSVRRFAADDPGIDRLVSIIAQVWRDTGGDREQREKSRL